MRPEDVYECVKKLDGEQKRQGQEIERLRTDLAEFRKAVYREQVMAEPVDRNPRTRAATISSDWQKLITEAIETNEALVLDLEAKTDELRRKLRAEV